MARALLFLGSHEEIKRSPGLGAMTISKSNDGAATPSYFTAPVGFLAPDAAGNQAYESGLRALYWIGAVTNAQATARVFALGDYPVTYCPYGVTAAGYPTFHNASGAPQACTYGSTHDARALVSVFTTHVDPLGGSDLVPLYRMSYQCGDELTAKLPPFADNAQNLACQSNPYHVSHVYTNEKAGIEQLYSAGYQLDGIGWASRADRPNPCCASSKHLGHPFSNPITGTW
jgi:hypothetical protein